MKIQILGPGCKNCALLERRTLAALAELGLAAEVSKVEDYDEILSFGIMATPGLVVDGRVLLSGKVPTTRALAELLSPSTQS
jgi:small redox-active disulfide protein 2